MWIDYDNGPSDFIGYLVKATDTTTGYISYSLRERPLRTNKSHEPRLFGWCGTTNNVSLEAKGAWRVDHMNNFNDRAQIVQLKGDELTAFLNKDGYPELAGEAYEALDLLFEVASFQFHD